MPSIELFLIFIVFFASRFSIVSIVILLHRSWLYADINHLTNPPTSIFFNILIIASLKSKPDISNIRISSRFFFLTLDCGNSCVKCSVVYCCVRLFLIACWKLYMKNYRYNLNLLKMFFFIEYFLLPVAGFRLGEDHLSLSQIKLAFCHYEDHFWFSFNSLV